MREPRTPLGETQRLEVCRDGCYPYEREAVFYRRETDGWYIRFPSASDEFELYARPEATDRTVKQLIRKQFDSTYSVNPDSPEAFHE